MVDFKVTSRKWSPTDVAENTQSTAYAMLYGYDTDFEFHIGLRANKKPSIQIVKLQRTKDDAENYIRHLHDVVAICKTLRMATSVRLRSPATAMPRCASSTGSATATSKEVSRWTGLLSR